MKWGDEVLHRIFVKLMEVTGEMYLAGNNNYSRLLCDRCCAKCMTSITLFSLHHSPARVCTYMAVLHARTLSFGQTK